MTAAHTLYAQAHRLLQAGQLDDATDTLRRLVALYPRFGEAWNMLGVVCDMRRDLHGAVDAYRRAINAGVRGSVWINLGQAQRKLGDDAAAQASFRSALAADPRSASAWHQLGIVLERAHDIDGAIDAYDRAARLAPADPRPSGAALALRRATADWSSPVEPWLDAYLSAGHVDSPPLLLLALPEASARMQYEAARRFATSQWGSLFATARLHAAPTSAAGRRIRVGYLSSDFREHAVSFLALEAITSHDAASCDVTLYSYGPATGDAWHLMARTKAQRFVDLSTVSDENAARQIAADALDVLVDLNGYTEHARVGILARRPAPVQATWIGYVGTLGHSRLADYLIGDSIVTPVHRSQDFAEMPAHLPRCFQPNGRLTPPGPVPPRSMLNLPDESVVFCSFNQVFKFHPTLWDDWCAILREVRGSVLWLAMPRHAAAVRNLRHEAQARGVAPERLVFAPTVARDEHLNRLAAADIALDTYPYNSGTTASDALRAGVPLLTVAGDTFAGRMACSLLTSLGLAECIHPTRDAMVSAAIALGADRDARSALRARLNACVQTSALFNPGQMAAELEALYRRMNRNAVEGRCEPIQAVG